MASRASQKTEERLCSFTVRTIYTCDTCSAEFSSKDDIIQHMDVHKFDEHANKPPSESLADVPGAAEPLFLEATTAVSESEWMRSVTQEPSLAKKQLAAKKSDCSKALFVCRECQRTFAYRKNCVRHMLTAHRTDESIDTSVNTSDDNKVAMDTDSGGAELLENLVPTMFEEDDDGAKGGCSDMDEVTEVLEVTGQEVIKEIFRSVSAMNTTYKTYYCSHCSSRHASADELTSHVKSEHGIAIHPCPMCPETFHFYSSLITHLTTSHSGKKPYPCELCLEPFATEDERSEHVKQHVANMCVTCGIRLRRRSALGFDPTILTCEVCYLKELRKVTGQSGDEQEGINDDDNTNRKSFEKPKFECIACGHGFRVRSNLRRHMRTHAIESCALGSQASLSCTECGHLFTLASNLRSHIRRRHMRLNGNVKLVKKYRCAHCGQLFGYASNLRRHVRNMHPGSSDQLDSTDACTIESVMDNSKSAQFDDQLYCPKCDSMFESQATFIHHVTYSHQCGRRCASALNHDGSGDQPNEENVGESQENAFKCPHCDLMFARLSGVNCHIRSQHAQFLQCGKNMTEVSSINLPYDGDTAKAFSCHMCPSIFSSAANLHRHLQCLHGTDSLPCDITPDDNHPTTSSRSYICPECKQHFFWPSSLRKHLRKMHGVGPSVDDIADKFETENGQLVCVKCKRHFANLYLLRSHLVAHVRKESCNSEDRMFLCQECGRSFQDRRQLYVHTLRHTGIKPHQCTLCDKSFLLPTHLNEHIATEHEGKRYICEYCGFESKSRSGLHGHLKKVHENVKTTGTRQHVCNVCTRTFWSLAALKKHESAHADAGSSKRKAMCGLCGLLYRHAFNLAHHITTVHGDEAHATPFACATCGGLFPSGPEFKRHYKSKHRNR